MRPSEIPAHELDNLAFTCEDAEDAADEGDIGTGYDLLSGGLYRAEQLRDEGYPWAEDLIERWRAAAEGFNRRYNRRQRARHLLPPLPQAVRPESEAGDD